jgi:ATP-dependent DNA helicase RecG
VAAKTAPNKPKAKATKGGLAVPDEAHDPRSEPITVLKGVGAKMAETLSKLGVGTVGDLLAHMPARYTRMGEVRPLAYWSKGDSGRVEVTVTEEVLIRRTPRMRMLVAEALDEKGKRVVLTWFGQHWLAKQLPGRTIVVQGDVDQPLRELSPARMTVKEWEYADDLEDEDYRAYLRPVYPATAGLSQARIRGFMQQALALMPAELPDPLPPEVRERYELCSVREALEKAHRPIEDSDPADARHRLVFEELFPSQLALMLLRRRDAQAPATALDLDTLASKVAAELPFDLSDGQVAAWARVRHHLKEATPARLLLQGEVGAGKTVIAALACAQAAAKGRIAVLVAPTEILANQHAESLRVMLGAAGLGVALVTGAQSAPEREAALASLAAGETLVAVGTHALFSEGLERFAFNLGLVVVDEQHRFGVAQRHQLVEAAQARGLGIHLLQLSATPIPRTLAMTVFGDLDVVDLPMRPDAIRNVKTLVVGDEYGWVKPLKEVVAQGDGAFIICPKIDDDGEGWSIESPELQRVWLRDFRFDVAHGRQKPAERAAVLKAFAAGDLDVVLATTVIEVGIDIKRASLIAILDADRFGLAQLHQLRGRVGRAGQAALCILQPSPQAGEEGLARLGAMTRLQDGKELAEFDLELRGTGAFVGESQAGASGFKHTSLTRDARVLVEARHAAKALLEADPSLAEKEHVLLRRDLLERISGMLAVRKS